MRNGKEISSLVILVFRYPLSDNLKLGCRICQVNKPHTGSFFPSSTWTHARKALKTVRFSLCSESAQLLPRLPEYGRFALQIMAFPVHTIEVAFPTSFYPIRTSERLPEREYGGHYFRRRYQKKDFGRYRDGNYSAGSFPCRIAHM